MITDIVEVDVDGTTVNYREYTDYAEYINHVVTESAKVSDRASMRQGQEDWYGTSTFDEAVALASYGWSEGYKKMQTKSTTFITHQGYLPELSRDMCGEFVDVDAFIKGEPECMFTFNGFKPQQFLRFVINTGGNCDVDADEIYERGAVLVNMIDTLESRGVRCEIWASMAVRNSGNKYVRRTKIKEFSDKLNVEKLTYCLCNASWHRRIGFAEKEANTEKIRKQFDYYSARGYGSSCDDVMPMKEGDVYISLNEGDYAEALADVKKKYLPEE